MIQLLLVGNPNQNHFEFMVVAWGFFKKIDLILGQCPEDHIDVKRVTCQPNLTDCSATEKGPSESLKGFHKCRAQGTQCPPGKTIFKAHGPLTGYCVPSDR